MKTFKPFRTQQEIAALLKKAEAAGLQFPPGFEHLTFTRIQEAYNGIGAEWQSNWSRSLLTSLRGFFEPVALIHDIVGEYFNDGSDSAFVIWNNVYWHDNAAKLIGANYLRINPYYYIQLRRARTMYRLLQLCGKKAWRAAYLKNQTKDNSNEQ